MLEALAVWLPTENADPGTWDELRDRFGDPARAALARNDISYYVEAVNAFRSQTVIEARNEFLTQSLDKLYDRTRVLIRRLVLVPGRVAAALDEHQRILDAMIAGEAEHAEELKRANIRSARQWFSDYKKFLL